MNKVKKSQVSHKKTAKSKLLNLQGNTPILSGLIFLVLIGFGVYFYKGQHQANYQGFQSNVATFEECSKSKGSQVIDTYPKQCKTADKVTFIEAVKEPVDTSNWATFTEITGFTFKCPPSWNCQKFKDTSATVYQNHYSNISRFQINLITPENFQQSFIRHPNYSTPVAWFNAVRSKNASAVKALPSTIRSVSGTDGLDYPTYYSYDLNKTEEIVTKSGQNGLIIPPGNENIPDTSVIVPLNDTDLVLVLISPEYLTKDPIVKAILTSINP